MEMVPLTPARKAQLDDYALRHGKDLATALDDMLAEALEWEAEDFRETVRGIQRGYEDIQAGRTRPVAEFLAEVRRKYDFSG